MEQHEAAEQDTVRMWRVSRVAIFIAFVIAALLATSANLLLAIARMDAEDPPTSVVDEFATQGVVLDWPAKPPSDVIWPLPEHIATERTFAQMNLMGWVSGNQNTTSHHMLVTRVGWPIPVLERVQLWWDWDDPAMATSTPPDSGFGVMWWNLLVLATGAGALGASGVAGILLFNALRWNAHIRLGRCVACQHPLAGSKRCPECGASA